MSLRDVECLNKIRINRERALGSITLNRNIRSACRPQINMPYFKIGLTEVQNYDVTELGEILLSTMLINPRTYNFLPRIDVNMRASFLRIVEFKTKFNSITIRL